MQIGITWAADAGAALDLLKNNAAPELLLTDIVLPGAMNGADLAREVLRLDPSIKVLFMSGYAPDGLDLDAAAGGEAVLLHKPFEIAALAHAVSNALNRGHKITSQSGQGDARRCGGRLAPVENKSN